MIDRSIADEAGRLITGPRADEYGGPLEGMAKVAALWSAYLNVTVTAADAAKMLLLMKIGRSQSSFRRDHFVDGIAYLLIAEGIDRGRNE